MVARFGSGVRRAKLPRGPRPHRSAAALLALAVLLAACGVAPQPIQIGTEECAHCRMVIGDERFAAQALNTRGKAHSFDAIECMAAFVAGETISATELHSVWIKDFGDPNGWIRAEDAWFLRSPDLPSPMGAGLTAHATEAAALEWQSQVGGELLAWHDVVRLARENGLRGHGGHGGHVH